MCKQWVYIYFLFLSSPSPNYYRSSFTKGCLPPKVIFHLMSSSIKGHLPPKVFFHRRSSSTQGHLPSKIFFHPRSSSSEGHLPPPKTPWLILYLREQSTLGVFKQTKSWILNGWSTFSHYFACQETPQKVLAL